MEENKMTLIENLLAERDIHTARMKKLDKAINAIREVCEHGHK